MVRWRYMTDEEAAAVADIPQPPPPTGDETLAIFEVVEGWVSPCDGDPVLNLEAAPTGWFVRPIETTIPGCSYSVSELRVLMNGSEVDMKAGTRVVFLPPNYRELADGA